MSDELIYTSAPRGLRPGSSGFCTVAATALLGPAWIERLESLSAYKPRFAVGDPREADNPVVFSYARLTVAGQTRSLLTRISPAGIDHTGRRNKVAHHRLIADHDRPSGGPAWAMRQPGVLRERWAGDTPRTLAPCAPLPAEPPPAGAATAWQAVTGDAGWASVLAAHAVADPARIVYVVCPPGSDALALVDEAVRLLPENLRWAVTFSTYFTEPVAAVACAWRCVIAGTLEAAKARGNVIDLTALDRRTPPESALAEAARGALGPSDDIARITSASDAASSNSRSTYSVARLKSATVPPVATQPSLLSGDLSAHRTSKNRSANFWLLAVGVPCVAACVAVLVLLMLSSNGRGKREAPALDRFARPTTLHAAMDAYETRADELAGIDNVLTRRDV